MNSSRTGGNVGRARDGWDTGGGVREEPGAVGDSPVSNLGRGAEDDDVNQFRESRRASEETVIKIIFY